MKINEFKKGALITKVEPRIYRNMDGMFGSIEKQDISYIGKKYEYIASANGLVYIKDLSPDKESPNYGDTKEIMLCQYLEGWEFWVDPKTL